MQPLIATREVLCHSPREVLWAALADTAEMNQAVGNRPLESEPLAGKTAARYLVRTRLYGLRLVYEEYPFEWQRPHKLSIERVFLAGPAYRYRYTHQLTELAAGGTSVTARIEITPRWALAWPFLWINTWLIANRLQRYVRKVDDDLQPGPNLSGGDRQVLIHAATHARTHAALLQALPRNQRALGERLGAFVAEGTDAEVQRIRPGEIADTWNVPRRTLVQVCLQAVVAGMLDLQWDIICPSCRTVASQVGVLSDLPQQTHCQLCDISIHVNLDRAVEATFRPSRAVRSLEQRPYCIGGPFRTPHVVSQATLAAGGTASLSVPEEAGRYRLFVRGGAAASIDVTLGAPPQVELTAGAVLAPAETRVAPAGTLVVRDALGYERHAKLEHLEWASRATTAHYVSTMDTFRRLFSAEILQPGLRVQVTRVVLVFTDLTGSAAMYTRLGDAAAYCFVQEHFAALEKVVVGQGGAIVKTIGDAVMAVFYEEQAAVRAAVGMQQAFAAFVAERPAAGDVQLCAGMFVGPCYLVRANEILDYFGQTVNIASRLQCQSRGGEIILPAEIAARGESQGWLTGARVIERFDAQLKGLDKPLAAVRVKAVAPEQEP